MTLTLPLAPDASLADSRAIVRIPRDSMQHLGLTAGDVVAIIAERTTHARAVPGPAAGKAIAAPQMLLDRIAAKPKEDVEVAAAPLPPLRTALLQLPTGVMAASGDLADALFDLPLTEGETIHLPVVDGGAIEATVVALEPSPAGLFAESTALTLQADTSTATTPYTEIGGLTDEIARVHEMVATPLLRPDLFARLGVPAPRGVLFVGPPGSGKTLLARGIAATTSAAFFQINGPEIVSKHYGESEAALRKIFHEASRQAPAIIFIDEIDAIAPRREDLSGEKQVERRVVAQLLTLMDGLAERQGIILMAATNLPDSLDPALRRPGRFDREISFAPPKAAQRAEILRIHLREAPLADDVDIAAIAEACHGYVGADLAALAREASLACLDRTVRKAGGEAAVTVQDLWLTQADLRHGLAATAPSTLRDSLVETPEVRFADVGGMAEAKAALHDAVLLPLAHKKTFAEMGLRPAAGIVLSGPSGTGKTLLARALAAEASINFIPVRPARILSQFLGDAERAIAALFAKARHAAPCLIFFDELDALAPRRTGKDAVQDRIVAQLLVEMDGLVRNTDVVLLAATNRPGAVDPALLRAGRFDQVIPVPLPTLAEREAILAVHTGQLPCSDTVELSGIAARMEGASGADLANLVQTAARQATKRAISDDAPALLTPADFGSAIDLFHQSIGARAADHIHMTEA